jgi:hypothetical protein
MQFKFCPIAALILFLLAVQPIEAGVVAYGDPVSPGNQLWDGSLGQDFDVSVAIDVIALGVFDSDGDSISGLLTVAIFASNGTQMTPTLTFTGTEGTLIGGDRFENLATPIILPAGSYSLTTGGWGSDLNGDRACNGGDCGFPQTPYVPPPTLNSDAGLISFTGVGFAAGSGFGYLAPTAPTSSPLAPFPADEFNAGSFEFAGAPEPAPAVELFLGLVALLIPGLRRRFARR